MSGKGLIEHDSEDEVFEVRSWGVAGRQSAPVLADFLDCPLREPKWISIERMILLPYAYGGWDFFIQNHDSFRPEGSVFDERASDRRSAHCSRQL